MAQDLASRRLTIILGASLAAVIALGIWIAVLIGRAQPDPDPQTPSTTSQTSAVEESDEPAGGDGSAGDLPQSDDSQTVQDTAGETTPDTVGPAPQSEESSPDQQDPSTSDGGSTGPETPESDDGGGPSSDGSVVQQSSP